MEGVEEELGRGMERLKKKNSPGYLAAGDLEAYKNSGIFKNSLCCLHYNHSQAHSLCASFR